VAPVTFLETVAQARALLESNGRISLRALAREFELEDDALDELAEELVDVQKSGEGEAGIAEMQQAMVELAGVGAGLGAPAFLCSLAAGLWRVGRHDEAMGTLGLGLAQAEQQGQHYYDAELHRLRAEILLDMDGNAAPEAEALFGQSLAIARRQEAKTFELRAATSLARLWQRQGKRDAARDLLAPIYSWFTEGGGTRDLIDAKALLEELGMETTSL
jgi:predicted ATPase